MLGALFTILGAVAFFMWVVLGHSTPAEIQRTMDASCPAKQQIIRYPEYLGGPHAAVCNPTFTAWRN